MGLTAQRHLRCAAMGASRQVQGGALHVHTPLDSEQQYFGTIITSSKQVVFPRLDDRPCIRFIIGYTYLIAILCTFYTKMTLNVCCCFRAII